MIFFFVLYKIIGCVNYIASKSIMYKQVDIYIYPLIELNHT